MVSVQQAVPWGHFVQDGIHFDWKGMGIWQYGPSQCAIWTWYDEKFRGEIAMGEPATEKLSVSYQGPKTEKKRVVKAFQDGMVPFGRALNPATLKN